MSKDFTNFEVAYKKISDDKYQFTMRHKKHEKISIQFMTGPGVIAQRIPEFLDMVLKDWARKYSEERRQPLTKEQRDFYNRMVSFCKEEGRRPSYNEIKEFLNVKSKGTAYYYVKKLVEMGWIWIDEHGNATPIDIALPD